MAYTGEQIYTNVRKNPIQDVALAALPLTFKFGETVIGNTVARAATSESIVNIPGRALSTPLAMDIGAAAKTGLGVWFVGQSAININAAPNTPEGKGRAIGDVGYQVGMIGIGIPIASGYTPVPRNNHLKAGRSFPVNGNFPSVKK